MSAAPPPPSEADALAARQQAVLAELVELGMRLTRALVERAEAQAAAGDAAPGGADPQLGFSRLSRAVRLTLAMQRKLADDEAARRSQAEAARFLASIGRRRDDEAGTDEDWGDGPEGERKARINARQGRIAEAIERALDGEDSADDDGFEPLSANERDELLWDADDAIDEAGDDPEFLNRPFPEAVNRIRVAIGLDQDPAVEGVADEEDERRAAEAVAAAVESGASDAGREAAAQGWWSSS